MGIFEDNEKALWMNTYANGLFGNNRNTDTFQQFIRPDTYGILRR
jgi:hypothetical protein